MYILKVVLVMKSSRWLAHLCAENPWYIFPDWKFRCYSLWNCLLYSCDRSMGVWGVWSNLFAHACLLLDTCLQCTSSNPLSQNYSTIESSTNHTHLQKLLWSQVLKLPLSTPSFLWTMTKTRSNDEMVLYKKEEDKSRANEVEVMCH